MGISGNSFGGGSMVTLNGTASAEVVGTRTQQSIGGRFYGLTTAGIPDEIGGIGYLEGSNGSVTAIFLAD